MKLKAAWHLRWKTCGMVLMPNKPQAREIVYTPEFKRNLRQLAKMCRHIKSDVEPIIRDLTEGKTPGDQIPTIRYEVFKCSSQELRCSQRKERWLSDHLLKAEQRSYRADNHLFQDRTIGYHASSDTAHYFRMRTSEFCSGR